MVTSRNTDIGALINSGSGNALLRVAQVNPLRVYVSVPENFGKEVHVGTDALGITITATGTREDQGEALPVSITFE